MKIASWNVNSVRVRLPNLLAFLVAEAPDILCLQELKCMEDAFPRAEIEAAGYQSAVVGQKSYNGVAILSKKPVTVVARDIGDEQARYIEIETDTGLHVIGIYAPNGNPIGTEKFSYKLDWLARLRARLVTLLEAETPFVLTGDFNIIPESIDASDPSAWTGDALFQPESRAMYRNFINLGLSDAFRVFEKAGGHYTFWDYQAGAWQRDHGIRIDHFLLSPQIADICESCTIHRDERGRENPSDHVPISVSLG